MQDFSKRVIFCGLLCCALSGCFDSSPPPPIQPAEDSGAAQKAKAKEEALKQLDGIWLLKSSVLAGERGTYSLLSSDVGELRFRIKNGAMEMRIGDGPWGSHSTLAIGNDPQSLLNSRADVVGQTRVILLRYKLEGNTLTTIQDNAYPDVFPDSFALDNGVERQRQQNVYTRISD